MAPVKFDDLPKAANEVLNDDYQTSGFQMKAKQKTNLDGAVVTTDVALWSKDCATPAKLTWKFPKPFGIAGLSVDKLEMDKAGKFKLEAVVDKAMHKVPDLKVEAKSDLEDLSKAVAGFTFTGIKDTQLKFETKPLGTPFDFTFEATKSLDQVTLGLKCTMQSLTAPDLGVKFESGPLVAALLAKDKFKVFSASACYKASADMKLAGTYEYGKTAKFGIGLSYLLQKGTTMKVKVQQDMSVSCGVKHDLAQGFTILAGGKYDSKDSKHSYGLQLSIE